MEGFVKKVRMGKRIEKAFTKGQSVTSQNQDEDPNKPPEPHVCTGHFHTDFTELCRRLNMERIPPVVPRAHRPSSASAAPAPEERQVKGGAKGKEDKKQAAQIVEPEPEAVEDPNAEPPPKTYTVRESAEYFKPTVQVEQDHPDKQDTVTEIYIRSWRVDAVMMEVLRQCLIKLDRLNTVNLWNAGLTAQTLETLASFLPECGNLKFTSLSIRYNGITARGAQLIAQKLGTTDRVNSKLLILNMNGNRVGDEGAQHFCKALRTNRTLLSLGLGNNRITDTGAKLFAEVLSHIDLTHEEIVERRKKEFEKGSSDRQKSPLPGHRRADSRDRPGSVRSSHAVGAAGKGGKSAKDKKGKDAKDDKLDKSKGKKDDKEKATKKASVATDLSKSTKGKDKGKGKTKGSSQAEAEHADVTEEQHPLTLPRDTRAPPGTVRITGNLAIISLNLASNQITEVGVDAFSDALLYQDKIKEHQHGGGPPCLMRLNLYRNKFSPSCAQFRKLEELLIPRDPFYKKAGTPDNESVSQQSVRKD